MVLEVFDGRLTLTQHHGKSVKLLNGSALSTNQFKRPGCRDWMPRPNSTQWDDVCGILLASRSEVHSSIVVISRTRGQITEVTRLMSGSNSYVLRGHILRKTMRLATLLVGCLAALKIRSTRK